MSSDSTPITLTRFQSALTSLPISNLYAKNTELLNSIAHMRTSNTQLEDYARENDDRECYEAVLENRLVINRFEERIEAIRREVEEVRGLPWRPVEGEKEMEPGEVLGDAQNGGLASGPVLNGESHAPAMNGTNGTASASLQAQAQGTGHVNGASAQTGDDSEGVFL